MDNLTHTLTGLIMSRAGLNRWCPRATPLLLLALNVADVDVVARFAGSLAYLRYHRGPTHALAAAPLLALVVVGLVRIFSRGAFPWRRSYAVALAGTAVHCLIDWTNVYPSRLLLPFSDRPVGAGFVNIVDLWIWTVLVAALAAPWLGRLVSTEIGAKPAAGRGWAVFALLFLAGYGFIRFLSMRRAEDVLTARVYSGMAPLRVAAIPGFANPFLWRGIVETRAFYSLHDVNLLDEFDPDGGRTLYKPEPSAPMEAASADPVFQEFLRFARFPYWRVVPSDTPETGATVEVMDLRFGAPPGARFVATAVVDSHLRVHSSRLAFKAVSEDASP